MANEPFDDEDGDGSRSAAQPKAGKKTSAPKDPAPARAEIDEEGDERVAPAAETRAFEPEPEPDAEAPAAHAEHASASGQRFVLPFQGKKVAVGLQWRQVVDQDEAWDFAKAGEAEGYDLWRFLEGNEPQLALGRRELGHRAGMPMLAAELALQYPGEWAGIFEIDGAYYVTAVSSDIIDPDADIAFGNFEEAYAFFEDLATRSSRLRRLASESLMGRMSLTGVESTDVEGRNIRFSTGLQAISNLKKYLGYGIPIAVILLTTIAVVKFAPDLITDVRRKLGLSPQEQKQQVVIPPAPWSGQPKAHVMLANCLDALRSVPREAYGWNASSLSCDGRTVQVLVQRTGSITEAAPPISWLDRWAKGQGELVTRKGASLGKPILAPIDPMRPNAGTITWRMPTVKIADRWRDSNRPSASLDAEARALWMALEDRFLKVTFRPVQDQAYFQVRDARVDMGFHQEDQVSPHIRKPGVFLMGVSMDPKTMNVIADVRMGLAKAFPTDENIEIVRNPALSSTEGTTVPPRPSR